MAPPDGGAGCTPACRLRERTPDAEPENLRKSAGTLSLLPSKPAVLPPSSSEEGKVTTDRTAAYHQRKTEVRPFLAPPDGGAVSGICRWLRERSPDIKTENLLKSAGTLSLLPSAFGCHLPHQRKARVTIDRAAAYYQRKAGVTTDCAAAYPRRKAGATTDCAAAYHRRKAGATFCILQSEVKPVALST